MRTVSATFVLSPGRCGTQWLSKVFSNDNPLHWVTHEPLHLHYEPTINSPENPLKKNTNILQDHLNKIKAHLDTGGNYLECGFPCWRHIAWFKNQLGSRCKVIYIHRNPIENAGSLLKLNAFTLPLLPHIPEKIFFHPDAEGALMPEYKYKWASLSPFEKCLYFWAEVNLQAQIYFEQFGKENWLTIPFGELFSAQARESIARFTSIKANLEIDAQQKTDEYGGLPFAKVSPELLNKHHKIKSLAESLGYFSRSAQQASY